MSLHQSPASLLFTARHSIAEQSRAEQSTNTAYLGFPSFPIVLSRQGSGVVAAVGSAVKSLRVGDAVYGMNLKRPMAQSFADGRGGFAAEYTVAPEDTLLVKPAHLSFEEAAVLLGNTVTAIQSSRNTLGLQPGLFPDRGASLALEGKTVLVTAGLGAATNVAAQYAKNVLGASTVITTVSTAKVALLDKCLPGVYDQVVDYQTQDLVKEVGQGTVDVLYCGRPDVWNYLPVMKSDGGVVAAIVATPPAKLFDEMMGEGAAPFWVRWVLDLSQWWYKWKFWGTGVQMNFTSGDLGVREDVEMAGEIIATGKVKGIYTAVSLDDLEAVKQRCEQTGTLKGGIGKVAIKMV